MASGAGHAVALHTRRKRMSYSVHRLFHQHKAHYRAYDGRTHVAWADIVTVVPSMDNDTVENKTEYKTEYQLSAEWVAAVNAVGPPSPRDGTIVPSLAFGI